MTAATSETSQRPNRPGGTVPAIGGGLLALGLLLTMLPNIVEKAADLSSPAFDVLQMVGGVALALACATFAFLMMRSLAHAGRRTAVR